MPTPTYTPLATVTLAASSSSVFFTEISQDYSDLVLTVEHISIGAVDFTTFNGDSGGNYSYVFAQGTGSSAVSSASTGNYILGGYSTSGVNGIVSHQIMDYSATDKHKTVLTRRDRPASFVTMFAQRWANTSAITSIGISASADEFLAGSTFKLFGIHGEVV